MKEKLCKFEELAQYFKAYGTPSRIEIRTASEVVLNELYSTFYKREEINESYSSGYLGYFYHVPVKASPALPLNKVKLIYETDIS